MLKFDRKPAAPTQPAPTSALAPPIPQPVGQVVTVADTDLQDLDFEETTAAAVEVASAAIKSMRGGGVFRFPEGNTRFRVLPPRKGVPTPYAMAMEHFYEREGGSGMVRYVCPRHHGNRGCPACVEHERLLSSGNGADFEAAADMEAKMCIYANLYVELAPGQWSVRVATIPFRIHETLTDYVKRAGVDPAHPLLGMFFTANKSGSGRTGTKYTATPDMRTGKGPVAPTPDGVKEILNARSDLAVVVAVPADEEIAKRRAGKEDRQLGAGR